MHYLGAVIEQLAHEDLKVDLARRHAQQRRDARRTHRQTSTERHPWWASLTHDSGQQDTGRKPLFVFDWHGLRAHQH